MLATDLEALSDSKDDELEELEDSVRNRVWILMLSAPPLLVDEERPTVDVVESRRV